MNIQVIKNINNNIWIKSSKLRINLIKIIIKSIYKSKNIINNLNICIIINNNIVAPYVKKCIHTLQMLSSFNVYTLIVKLV